MRGKAVLAVATCVALLAAPRIAHAASVRAIRSEVIVASTRLSELRTNFMRGLDTTSYMTGLNLLLARTVALETVTANMLKELMSNDSSLVRDVYETRAIMLAASSLRKAVDAYRMAVTRPPEEAALWESVAAAHETTASALIDLSEFLYRP